MTGLQEFEKQNRKDICDAFIEFNEVAFESFLKDNDCVDNISIDEEHDEVYSEPGNYEYNEMMYEFCLNHPEYWSFVADYFKEWN